MWMTSPTRGSHPNPCCFITPPVATCTAGDPGFPRWLAVIPPSGSTCADTVAPPPAPIRPFVITELAADIACVMDALDIEKTHLVGASAGGIVSLQFAHDFPGRLHSLTLVASTPRLAQMGADMDASGWGDTLRREGTRAWLLSDTDKRFGPDTPREVIDWYADEGAKTEASEVLALQACLLAADLAPSTAPRSTSPR